MNRELMAEKVFSAAVAVGVAAALTLSAPTSAHAQESADLEFGVEGSYGTEIEAVAVGGRAMVTFPQAEGLGVMGSFDWYFPDAGDYYEINGNAVYTIQTSGGGVAPYLGAGVNIATASNGQSVTNTGLNGLGGFKLGSGPVTPFVEGRYATTGDGQFVITGGILF